MTQARDLSPDSHEAAQALLAWYATGAVDADDRARVERHLLACPQCQADLTLERRLAGEVAGLSMGVEQGWAALLPRLHAPEPKRPARSIPGAAAALAARVRAAWSASPAWVGWAVAAQAVILVVIVAVGRPPAQEPGYRALGAAQAPRAANLVVIFRPDVREEALRQALRSVDGRMVDGPTAADAYLLNVPASARASALAKLRARADIELAEPIDAGAAP